MEPGTQPPKKSKTPKLPNQSSLRQRRVIALALVGSALLVATIVLAIFTMSTRGQSTPDVHQTDISQVLSFADQHKLRSAVIAGNLVTVTTTDGQHYSATKEDGQPLTQYLRDRNVSVSITQPIETQPAWGPILMDVALFAFLGVIVVVMLRRSGGANGSGQTMPFG